jgi:excisionase family DNA binding protein
VKITAVDYADQEIILERITEQWTPEYVSVGFIARRCGVSNSTVLRWIGTGQIPAFRLPGGHFRISRTDFSYFLEKFHMSTDDLPTENHSYNR